GCDTRPDDIADAKQFRRNLRRNRAALKWRAKNLLRYVFPEFKGGHQRFVNEPDAKAREDRFAAQPAGPTPRTRTCRSRNAGEARVFSGPLLSDLSPTSCPRL